MMLTESELFDVTLAVQRVFICLEVFCLLQMLPVTMAVLAWGFLSGREMFILPTLLVICQQRQATQFNFGHWP